jgi:predicted MFS family arabinose efflux permease
MSAMPRFWRPALAGAAAVLCGIGLARFAYVPIFPAMVAAGWVEGGGAGLLGAANLAGYLAGALGGRRIGRSLGVPAALDLGMGLALLAFCACAWNGGLAWLALWRALAGVAGGVLMALAGPSVQGAVAPNRRGAAGGVVMGGAGAGIALAALLVPALLARGLPATWLGLAAAVGIGWILARPSWPDPLLPAQGTQVRGTQVQGAQAPPPAEVPRVPWLLLGYGLSGAGMVAPMVYLADLAVRGHGLPFWGGSAAWFGFGLGALAGTLVGGRAADLWGGRRALWLWLLVQAVALALMLVPSGLALAIAAPAAGFAGIGATAVALAAARELAGAQAAVIWIRATAAYALAQAGTAFALAALFSASGERHAVVFGAGLLLSVAALAVAYSGGRRAAQGDAAS